jgi:hypothetical protein
MIGNGIWADLLFFSISIAIDIDTSINSGNGN